MTQSSVPAIQTRSFAEHREGFRTVASRRQRRATRHERCLDRARRLGVQRRGARAPLSRDVPRHLDTECTFLSARRRAFASCLPALSQREPARTSLYRHKTHFFKCIFSRKTKGVGKMKGVVSQSKRIILVLIASRPLFAAASPIHRARLVA